jgi:hypothetical protein
LTPTSSASIAERLVVAAEFELPGDYFDRVAREVAALTLRDFHRFVVKELDPARQVFAAFGNAEAVGDAITAANAER